MGKRRSVDGRRRVTAAAVGRLAGVSASAVSRTFTPGASVSQRTRDRVLAAADQLGYRPNLMARSLMTRRTNLIGILVGDFRNPFYLQVLDRFTQTIQAQGSHCLILNAGATGELSEAVQMMLQYEVDGLIVTSATLPASLARRCADQGIPVVIFARFDTSAPTNAVCCDNVAGGAAAAELLLERGYERLAFIGGIPGVSTTIDRRRGFVEALERHEHPLWAEESGGDHSYAAGYGAATRLLQNRHPPDALFCVSDIVAMGAMDAIRYEFGVSVPEEMGIVGFDDIALAGAKAYALSTVRQPLDKMVSLTTQIVMDGIQGSETKPKLRFVGGELIVRKSVRPLLGRVSRMGAPP